MRTTSIVAHALGAALESGLLIPVFQPIWTVARACWGFEALSRFPNGSAPDAVWALARRHGTATALDRVALTTAIEAAAHLGGRLFLNVSAPHFRDPAALAALVDSARVVWEVTECDSLGPDDLRGLRRLQEWGYTVAMDDAGAGHSTMHRLGIVRPNIVKLDRPIVQVWAAGHRDPLRRWVEAAQGIGAAVIAEGIEDASWVAGLAAEGVDAVQGFALGRPAPQEHWITVDVSEYSSGELGPGVLAGRER